MTEQIYKFMPSGAWLDAANAHLVFKAYDEYRASFGPDQSPPALVHVTDYFGAEHWLNPYITGVVLWTPEVATAVREWDAAHAPGEKKEWE